MSENIERIKCLIIGSGPAGYSAAIYAARADMKPVMYTGMQMGGQLTTTTEVDNYPGYKNGTDGTAMMEDLKHQAERFGTEVRFGMVTKVDLSDKVGGIHKIIVDEENDEVYFTPIYYTLAHFSKFIRPEAKVINVENSDKDLLVTAAENLDGTIAVVLFNEGTTSKNISLSLNDKNVAIQIQGQAIQTLVITN